MGLFRHAQIICEQSYNEALCARTGRLRREAGFTAQQMAEALGILGDRYRKYEFRSPMPHYLLDRFAVLVGCDLEYLLTGRAELQAPPFRLGSQRQRAIA